MLVREPCAAVVRSKAWSSVAPLVSVVVTTHDRSLYLAGMLESLASQDLIDEFEVVVVDDGSPDPSWEVLAGLASTSGIAVHALRVVPNRGPAHGRNVGIAHARAPIVAFTDDDCLPEPTWLSALLAPFAESADIVQGKTVPIAGSHRSVWDRSIHVEGPGLFETCNIAYRRDDLMEVGGFHLWAGDLRREATRHFGEDTDLGCRLVSVGKRLVFVQGALVRHRWLPGSFGGWLRERRNADKFAALARRHPEIRSLFWHRVFLTKRTAAFDLALVGVIGSLLGPQPWGLAATLPWIAVRWPDARRLRGGRPATMRLAQLAVGDLVELGSLIHGAFRHRIVVL